MKQHIPAVIRNSRGASRDFFAMAIVLAATILFVGTGSSVIPAIARNWALGGQSPSKLLIIALLLNIALIIFGMRRFREAGVERAERLAAEESARRFEQTDHLTGCMNRSSFIEAGQELQQMTCETEETLSCISVDLENFKQINEIYGNNEGDRILIDAAKEMRNLLPDGTLIAKMGSKAFACILRHEAGAEYLKMTDVHAARLIEELSKESYLEGNIVGCNVSIGKSHNQPSEKEVETSISAETLISRAQIALTHSQKASSNASKWFALEMEDDLRHRNELKKNIAQAVQNDEFEPYYEQQIDLKSGDLAGFEMLARWKSPTLGFVGPVDFIPIAEELGLIADLSQKLIEKALQDAKKWAPQLTMSVNISPIQLRDPWFSQKLLKMMVAHNFPAHRLEIEITESCLHDNVDTVHSIITSLKNQGIKVSLDDFGTGYSSLSQLRALPFDRLKIDRSFVSELNANNANEKLINAILSLGDGLDIPMTAEGIEDSKILEVLRKKGPMKGQGYLYGRPESADVVLERLAKMGLLADSEMASRDTDAQASQDKTRTSDAPKQRRNNRGRMRKTG